VYDALGPHRRADEEIGVILPARINRCGNPSNEINVSGYVTTSSFWINEGAAVTQETSLPAVAGKAMGKLAMSGAATFEGMTRNVTLTAGEPVTVSLAVRGKVGGESVHLGLGDSVNGNARNADAILTTAPQRIFVTLVPGKSGASNWGLIGPNSKVAQTVYYDAVQVETADAPTDYVDGDQLGCKWLGTPGLSASEFRAVDTTYPLRKFIEALCLPSQPIYDLVRERDGQKGWEILMDPDECPAQWLPYLAKHVGVVITDEMTEEQIRNEIREPTGWKRGQPEAIRIALRRTLTGEEPLVIIRPRTPSAGQHYIRTLLSQTPDPKRTERVLREKLPAWEALDYQAIEGVSVLDVASSAKWATVADLAAAWPSVKALAEILPTDL
jgi:hypothetical protein